MKAKLKNLCKNKYVKILLWSLFVLAFLSPFPVPYLYKLDRELVAEGMFLKHSFHYEFNGDRQYGKRVDSFLYLDSATRSVRTMDMDASDCSKVANTFLETGQYVYVYAVGPLKWTAATSIKNDLSHIFFMRALIEFSVRAAFLLIIFACIKISSIKDDDIGGGGLHYTCFPLLFGGRVF